MNSLTNQIKNIEIETEIVTNEEEIKKLEEQVEIIRTAERDTITENTQNNNTRRAPDNDSSSEEEE